MKPEHDETDRRRRRRRVLRTAWLLAGIVVLIYLMFIGRGIYNYLT